MLLYGKLYCKKMFNFCSPFPFSDIDLVILGKWEHLPLFTLHDELVRSGIPRANNLMVLDKAAVSFFAILILNTLS